jgi:Aldo/keto reductase family
MYQARYFKDNYFNAIEVIRPVAERHNLTLLEVALRWVINHSQLSFQDRDGVIIGCSSVEQLESNLKDFEKGPLPDDVVQALDVPPCSKPLISRRLGNSSNPKYRTTGMHLVTWTVPNRRMHVAHSLYVNSPKFDLSSFIISPKM